MKYLALLLVALTACTSSVQVIPRPIPDTIVAPADSGYGTAYGPVQGVAFNPDCDSLRVAQELLRRALADVAGDAQTYAVRLDGELTEAGRQIDSLRGRVDYYRARVRVNVSEPPKPVAIPPEILATVDALTKENAELRQNQEIHDIWWKIGLSASMFAAGALLMGLYCAARRFLPM